MATGTIKAVVSKSDVVNNLTTNDSTKVLSAAQGKALNDKIATYSIGTNTLANIQTALASFGATLSNAEIRPIWFTISTSSGLFNTTSYYGTIRRDSNGRYNVYVQGMGNSEQTVYGNYMNSTWTWSNPFDQITVMTGLTSGIKTIALDATKCPDNSVRWVNTSTTNTSELPNGNSRYGLACISRRNSTSISITLYPENGNMYTTGYNGSSWSNWFSPSDQMSNKASIGRVSKNVPKNNGTAKFLYSEYDFLYGGHAYLVTAIGTNSWWKYAGVLFLDGTRTSINKIDAAYLDATVDSTGITITNLHPDYDMTVAVEMAGSV